MPALVSRIGIGLEEAAVPMGVRLVILSRSRL